jgi:flagellar motor component MotA
LTNDIDTTADRAFAKGSSGPMLGAALGLALLVTATITGSYNINSLFSLAGLAIVFGGVAAVAFMSFPPDDVCKAIG